MKGTLAAAAIFTTPSFCLKVVPMLSVMDLFFKVVYNA